MPEMVKAGRVNENFKEILLDVISSVWQERGVGGCYIDPNTQHIRRETFASYCDNW